MLFFPMSLFKKKKKKTEEAFQVKTILIGEDQTYFLKSFVWTISRTKNFRTISVKL